MLVCLLSFCLSFFHVLHLLLKLKCWFAYFLFSFFLSSSPSASQTVSSILTRMSLSVSPLALPLYLWSSSFYCLLQFHPSIHQSFHLSIHPCLSMHSCMSETDRSPERKGVSYQSEREHHINLTMNACVYPMCSCPFSRALPLACFRARALLHSQCTMVRVTLQISCDKSATDYRPHLQEETCRDKASND